MPETQSEEPTGHDSLMGYSIVEEFLRKEVRAFLVTGNTLQGTMVMARGKYIYVRGDRRECIINLDHVTSLTLI